MKTLFDLCTPRGDVLGGNIKESDFAADLAQVLNGKAPREYLDPAIFFANTHPTQGLRRLLANVCLRLTGKGGEASAIFRLDTHYGGGKTHSLIALRHVAAGMKGVTNVAEFIDPVLVPQGAVHVAAFDGENADPANGRPLGQGLKAFTPWGEIAFALRGVEGYEMVRASDVERTAPGAETIRQLFGGTPSLILLDELSIYLRKVKGRKEQDQLAPFLTSLFKAVESSPGAVLVFTLAIGKSGRAVDAYSDENEFIARKLEEAESVAARKATLLDPTAEHETAQVLRRRLFSEIDDAGAAEVARAYDVLWRTHAGDLPEARLNEDRAAELSAGYPFHPALMATLTDKLSTLNNFHRVRGMLRLLTQAIATTWIPGSRPRGMKSSPGSA
jgi:predicted AAA+ superfamily ATPase